MTINPSQSEEKKCLLVRIDLIEGKSEEYRGWVGDKMY
jgi:hypothetical protein